MKFMKLLVPLLLGSFLVMPAIATEIEDFMSWAQHNEGISWVKYNSDYIDDSKVLSAKISHSESGHQRLYFRDYYADNLNTCKYKTTVPDSITMIFNGQAVKMLRWCQKFSDINQYYFNLTPETDRGDSYVINIFKVATSPIEIQYDNETIHFPVIGFTKAWNSAGGNAI